MWYILKDIVWHPDPRGPPSDYREHGSHRRADEDDEDRGDPQLEISVGASTLTAVKLATFVSLEMSHHELECGNIPRP